MRTIRSISARSWNAGAHRKRGARRALAGRGLAAVSRRAARLAGGGVRLLAPDEPGLGAADRRPGSGGDPRTGVFGRLHGARAGGRAPVAAPAAPSFRWLSP